MPVSENQALTRTANAVATSPGFHPPYQALTMTATAKPTSRLSKTSERKSAGISARVVLSTATKYRSAGALEGGTRRVRKRGRLTRICRTPTLFPDKELHQLRQDKKLLLDGRRRDGHWP